MSPRLIGVAMLVVGSVTLGICAGALFYRLFLGNLPPLTLSTMALSAAHATFLFYGVALGLAIALWSLAVIALSRFFKSRAPAA